jgi:hypothetical protein
MVGTASVEDVQDREETLPHADFLRLIVTNLCASTAKSLEQRLRGKCQKGWCKKPLRLALLRHFDLRKCRGVGSPKLATSTSLASFTTYNRQARSSCVTPVCLGRLCVESTVKRLSARKQPFRLVARNARPVPGAAEVIHLEPRCQRRRPHFIHGCPDAVIRLYIMKCLRLLQSADIDTCMYGVQVEDDTPAQSTGEQQDR